MLCELLQYKCRKWC